MKKTLLTLMAATALSPLCFNNALAAKKELPSMVVSPNATVLIQGVNDLDHHSPEEMFEDGKLDAIEIFNILNYGPARWGTKLNKTSQSQAIVGEIAQYCQNRIQTFIKNGANPNQVKDLGFFAAFNLEDALILKGLDNSMKAQAKFNTEEMKFEPNGYHFKGKLGEVETPSFIYGSHSLPIPNPKGNPNLMAKVIQYMNNLTPREVDKLKALGNKAESTKNSYGLILTQPNLNVHLEGNTYDIRVKK